MIVADTNLVSYLVLLGARTPEAEAVRRKDRRWVLPLLWRHEFLNVLALYHRRGGAGLDACIRLWEEALRTFGGAESDVDERESLALACRHAITAYDAQYIALATRLHVPLVTEDAELIRKFPDIAISMSRFVSGHP